MMKQEKSMDTRNYVGEEKMAAGREMYPHERAAQIWTAAHNRLNEAGRDKERACEEYDGAKQAEEEAWLDLHESSGRIPPRKAPAVTETMIGSIRGGGVRFP